MTARIIETNDNPLNKVEVEGITADIIENALKNALKLARFMALIPYRGA